MNDVVLSTIDNGIRTISLNRPERLNAINGALIQGLCQAFAEANQDPATRVIIFTGIGRAFCAGADLKESPITQDNASIRNQVEMLQQMTREIVLGSKIVIGAINGWAVGGGLEWVINCDFTIWAESAKAFFPEIQLGTFCTGGVTSLLPRLVGSMKARELLLFGREVGTEELLELGIAWRVVPDDRVMPEAHEVASQILELPAGGVSDLKRTLALVSADELETAISMETDLVLKGLLKNEGRVG